jgi:hypothetical protein
VYYKLKRGKKKGSVMMIVSGLIERLIIIIASHTRRGFSLDPIDLYKKATSRIRKGETQ